jgi:cyclase
MPKRSHSIRVIPRLDIKGPNLIKGIQFDGHRVLGSAREFAEIYYAEGADELIYQDAVASLYQRNGLADIVRSVARKVFIPITVAGGIRTLTDIQELLRAGADKVAINTAAVSNPTLLKDASRAFGTQCIVSSIEAFRGADGKYRCWVDYGREPTSVDAIEWASRVEELGVGEILLTSVNREGMGSGYDLDLIAQVAGRVHVPLIACGGVGSSKDFASAVLDAGADGVSAASVFHYHYARPKPDQFTMQKVGQALRMGKPIDAGNIDFLNRGYGGQRAITVTPCSVSEAKQAMRERGLSIREAE